MPVDSKKRKHDPSPHATEKRLKLTGASHPVKVTTVTDVSAAPMEDKGKGKQPEPQPTKPALRINKLVPPRPFPTVPTSVSATGPRSAHKEGKNYMCLSRKTSLGTYMRRCKDVIIKDGYKTLHLSAMGAAIPLLVHLSAALPPILPFARDEIHTEITTGTVEVQDEIIPDDEDEDISYQTRGKSTLMIVMKIGDGEFEGDRNGPLKKNGRSRSGNNGARTRSNEGGKVKAKAAHGKSQEVVFQEPEQDGMDLP